MNHRNGNRGKPAPARPSDRTDVHVVEPTAVYLREQFQAIFRLRASTLRRELKEGRLRIAKRAGRYYLLGEWILEWLRRGEVKRKGTTAEEGGP